MNKYEDYKKAYERIELVYHSSFGSDNADLDKIKELIEKEKPMKPLKHKPKKVGYKYKEYSCPSCKNILLYEEQRKCDNCGQKIDL